MSQASSTPATTTAPNTVPLWDFDRGKPFYPLVMSFVTQWLGFKELFIRGSVGPRVVQGAIETLLTAKVPENEGKEAVSRIELLNGPLTLGCSFQDDYIKLDPDEIAKQLLREKTGRDAICHAYKVRPLAAAVESELLSLNVLYKQHLLRYGSNDDILVDPATISSDEVLRKAFAVPQLAARHIKP